MSRYRLCRASESVGDLCYPSEEYPELVNDYCKCATEKITQAMTPEEYTKWMEKPRDEQTAAIRPIIQTCADIMTKLIELTKTTKPTKEDLKQK